MNCLLVQKISDHNKIYVTLLSLRRWAYNTIAKYTGQTTEMVELYDKNKGNTKTLRMFKDLQANNPKMILRFIEDEPTEQPQNTFIKKVDPIEDTPIIDDKANDDLFDQLFAKIWTDGAMDMKYDARVISTEKSFNDMLGFIRTIAKDDSLIEDALENYTPNTIKLIKPSKTVGMSKELKAMKTKAMNFGNKPNDYLKLKKLVSNWIDLGIEDEYIQLYIERAKAVGIYTEGLV